MRPTRFHSRRISAATEGGFTLVELAVTMTLLLVVLGAVLTVFESVQRSAGFVRNRSETLDHMRVAMDQMTKDVRQATSVSQDSTTARLEMTTYVLGDVKQVIYEASGTDLTRSVDGGDPVRIQDLLTSTELFTYTESIFNVDLVTLTLSVRPVNLPDTTLVLTSEVRLRNMAGEL